MPSSLATVLHSDSSEAEQPAELHGSVLLARRQDEIHTVLMQLKLLPTEDLHEVFMQGPLRSTAISAVQTWRPALQAGDGLLYVELLRRLQLTAAELSQAEWLPTMQCLSDTAKTAEEEAAISQLSREWHTLIRYSQDDTSQDDTEYSIVVHNLL